MRLHLSGYYRDPEQSEMSEQSSLVSLLGPLPDQDTSLHFLLQSLDCQARIMHEKVGE